MLTPCGSQPFKFITIHLAWHWPVCCDCAVVTSAVLSVSNVCNFNITKMMKYGVFVGKTGHFDNEINLAGLGNVDNFKPQQIGLFSRWLRCGHYLRVTSTRTSCRRSSTNKIA